MNVWANIGVCFAVALVYVTLVFAISLARKRYDTIDTAWGLGFAVIAVVTFALADGNTTVRFVLTALTLVWGVRLSVHLHLRNKPKGEDPRYQRMVKRAKGNPRVHMFVRVFLVQGVILWFVSLPVQVGQFGAAGLGVVGWIGIALWLVGFVFESVGDWQLTAFGADPANKGKVLDSGLWHYTRHPNYFGDACVWWGLFLIACHHPAGIATVLSPIAMTALLAKGTGKPMLEKQMAHTRPGYAEYVARTSGFLPLPPKKTKETTG
jgi:steroid 5-alpha reductase family enzyme